MSIVGTLMMNRGDAHAIAALGGRMSASARDAELEGWSTLIRPKFLGTEQGQLLIGIRTSVH
jgi:hypothetical protein